MNNSQKKRMKSVLKFTEGFLPKVHSECRTFFDNPKKRLTEDKLVWFETKCKIYLDTLKGFELMQCYLSLLMERDTVEFTNHLSHSFTMLDHNLPWTKYFNAEYWNCRNAPTFTRIVNLLNTHIDV